MHRRPQGKSGLLQVSFRRREPIARHRHTLGSASSEIEAVRDVRHVSQRTGMPTLFQFFLRTLVYMERLEFITRPQDDTSSVLCIQGLCQRNLFWREGARLRKQDEGLGKLARYSVSELAELSYILCIDGPFSLGLAKYNLHR